MVCRYVVEERQTGIPGLVLDVLSCIGTGLNLDVVNV